MKTKPNLECVECGHLFHRSAKAMLKSLTNGDDIQCPKCKGFDVEPAGCVSKTFTQHHAEVFGQGGEQVNKYNQAYYKRGRRHEDRRYKRWTPLEIKSLKVFDEIRLKDAEISYFLGRSYSAIQKMRARLK